MPNYEILWADESFKRNKNRTMLHCDLFLGVYDHMIKHVSYEKDISRTLTDWGCGTGKHAERIKEHGIEIVALVDIAKNALQVERFEDRFYCGHIMNVNPPKCGVSYCTDVLEHIEADEIPHSLENIVEHTERPGFLFINVANNIDMWCGDELHVTQKPIQWWNYIFGETIRGDRLFTYNLFNSSFGTFWYLG